MRFISEDHLLCSVTCALKSRWAWDKNTITIIINIRVSSIAPESHGSHVKDNTKLLWRGALYQPESTDHTSKTTQNCCDVDQLRRKLIRYLTGIQSSFSHKTQSEFELESSWIFKLLYTSLCIIIFDYSKYSNIRLLQIFNWQLPSVTFYSKNQYVLRIFLGPVKT